MSPSPSNRADGRPDAPLGVRIGQELELTVLSMAHGGAGIARHEGQAVFIRHVAPGERVRARITELGRRNRFALARLLEVLQPSPDRRRHPWPAADALIREEPVGGAEYGHLQPMAQRAAKAQVLRDQMVRLGGFSAEDPLIAGIVIRPVSRAFERAEEQEEPGNDAAPVGYRTRVHCAVSPEGEPGMHPHQSTRLIPVRHLPLATERVNALGLGRQRWPGIQRIDIAAPEPLPQRSLPEESLVEESLPAGSLSEPVSPPLVVFTAAPGQDPAQLVGPTLDTLRTAVTGPISALLRPAPVPGRGRRDPAPFPPVTLCGEPFVIEQIRLPGSGEIASFRVGAGGFWQIHRAAPQLLAEQVAMLTGLAPGECAWDLYGGAGLFARVLVEQVGAQGEVWSVEGSPVTAADAAHNVPAARSTCQDVARALRQRAGSGREGAGRAADVVVLDPPRQGAGGEVIELLDRAGPRRIVYIACDPAALGRDAGFLRERGWLLRSVSGWDLYPQTHHLEAIAVFDRNPQPSSRE